MWQVKGSGNSYGYIALRKNGELYFWDYKIPAKRIFTNKLIEDIIQINHEGVVLLKTKNNEYCHYDWDDSNEEEWCFNTENKEFVKIFNFNFDKGKSFWAWGKDKYIYYMYQNRNPKKVSQKKFLKISGDHTAYQSNYRGNFAYGQSEDIRFYKIKSNGGLYKINEVNFNQVIDIWGSGEKSFYIIGNTYVSSYYYNSSNKKWERKFIASMKVSILTKFSKILNVFSSVNSNNESITHVLILAENNNKYICSYNHKTKYSGCGLFLRYDRKNLDYLLNLKKIYKVCK